MIDITLLGTSSFFPIPARALTAAYLSCGGHAILFDCGEGTQVAIKKYGLSLMNVDIIALTHYHGDHIFGLPGLLQTLMSTERTKPIYITGPKGLNEILEPILKLVGSTHYEINALEIPQDGLRLSDVIKGWFFEAKLSAFKTEHRVVSQGYCFTLGRAGKFLPDNALALGVPVNQWKILQKGQSVQVGDNIIFPEQVLSAPRKGLKFIFTGDTIFCDSIIAAAQNANLMICDSTYGKNEQAELATDHGHMNFAQAAQIAKSANVKQLWLSHYSQRILFPQQFLGNATAIFENTICGKDGMSATLKFEE